MGAWIVFRHDLLHLQDELRHDWGSQYLSDDYQAEIRTLGMESSPAFVRQPEGNGASTDSSAR